MKKLWKRDYKNHKAYVYYDEEWVEIEPDWLKKIEHETIPSVMDAWIEHFAEKIRGKHKHDIKN